MWVSYSFVAYSKFFTLFCGPHVMHESLSHKGSCARCANLQGIKSPAVPGRGVWLPAGAGGEQVDGRRESRVAAVVSLGSKQCGCRCFSSPSTPEWRTGLPALGWAGGAASTGAQQRCKSGVLREGQRHRQTPHGRFCHWLLSHPLPQASLIRT